MQFHLEVDRHLIDRWLTVPDNQAVLKEERDRIDAAAIRLQSQDAVDALQSLSRDTFSRWIDRFELAPRRRNLPSR